jgi:hypothetical protein
MGSPGAGEDTAEPEPRGEFAGRWTGFGGTGTRARQPRVCFTLDFRRHCRGAPDASLSRFTVAFERSLYRTFATPWADYSASQPLAEPNYHLPACYNVTPPAPSAKRAKQWSDETLFFAFYAMPRDQFQDVAAQELLVVFSP